MNKKVYYRGDRERGHEIIKALESLGGDNGFNLLCDYDDYYYYIGEYDIITHCHIDSSTSWLLTQCYLEQVVNNL